MQDRRERRRLLPSSRPCGWPTKRPPTLFSSRTPGEELAKCNRGKQRRTNSGDRGDCNRAGVGKILGVATTTTAAGVTAGAKAVEAHRVLVWLRAKPRGQLWSNNWGSSRSSGGGN